MQGDVHRRMEILLAACSDGGQGERVRGQGCEAIASPPGLRKRAFGVGLAGATEEWVPDGVPFTTDEGVVDADAPCDSKTRSTVSAAAGRSGQVGRIRT